MCLFRKCQLQGLRSRQKRRLLFVNKDFGGKRNAVNGTFGQTLFTIPLRGGINQVGYKFLTL
jgi:hypothetical protein